MGTSVNRVAASEAETSVVLAIDIGSSSARVMVYDGRGRAVDGLAAQVLYDLRVTGGQHC